MSSEWEGLGHRLQRRAARTIDVLSILFFDALVLIAANGLILLLERFTSDRNDFFRAAKDLSHGSFLLLYVFWVGWDVWEFVKHSRTSSN
jgi:hypothetical protein